MVDKDIELIVEKDTEGLKLTTKEAAVKEPVISAPIDTVVEKTEFDVAPKVTEEPKEVTGPRVEQHYPLDIPSNKSTEVVGMPTDYPDRVRDALNKLPNIDISDSAEAKEWINVLNEGLGYINMQQMFKDAVEDPKKSFTQRPEHNGKPLVAASPKFEKMENTVLKGERAVIRVIQSLGLGNLFQVPLWHTGIWVTIKPTTESSLIELNRQLINDKIQFGRYSYGLAFANTTSYTTDRLIDFVLEHIYSVTINTDTLSADYLKKTISCQDIPVLLWGIISTIYPNGYKYKRACISDPEKCNHVLEETINITKLLWSDITGLTDYQKEHMSYRQSRSRSIEQIQKYKDELSRIHKSRVQLSSNNDIYLTIKTPTIYDYIDSGHHWVSTIVKTVEDTISSDIPVAEKETLITRYAQASRLRTYAHWVESIEIGTNISNDPETVNEILNVISSDDELSNDIMAKIKEYINNSMISVVGIPDYKCPKCGTKQNDINYPKFVNIIPLDVQQLFFSLSTQRLTRLTER